MFSPLIVALNFSCWRYERYFKKASAISFMQIYTGCCRSVCAIFRNANRLVFSVHCNLFKKAKFETNIHSFEKEFLHLRIVDLFTQIFQKSTNFDLPIILGYYDDYNKRQQYLDKKEKKEKKDEFLPQSREGCYLATHLLTRLKIIAFCVYGDVLVFANVCSRLVSSYLAGEYIRIRDATSFTRA